MKKSELKKIIKECLGGMITDRAMIVPETQFNKKRPVKTEATTGIAVAMVRSATVFENDKFTVVDIKNAGIAKMLGQGSKWGISYASGINGEYSQNRHAEEFGRFIKYGKIFFILNKTNSKEMYAAWIPNDESKIYLYNIDNKEIDANKLSELGIPEDTFTK